jgi:hypothetical protein
MWVVNAFISRKKFQLAKIGKICGTTATFARMEQKRGKLLAFRGKKIENRSVEGRIPTFFITFALII